MNIAQVIWFNEMLYQIVDKIIIRRKNICVNIRCDIIGDVTVANKTNTTSYVFYTFLCLKQCVISVCHELPPCRLSENFYLEKF